MFGVPLGPFHLTGRLDQGGMGQVWHAVHVRSGVPVAVKLLRDDRVALAGAFLDEVRAVAQLDHPSIIAVLDYGRVDDSAARRSDGRLHVGTPWMAIEYCSGGTLGQSAPASWPAARDALLAVLGALASAHARDVLHRDVTPDNVLVATAHDARPGVKLTDFGLAPLLERGASAGAIVGTPAYMAPEQLARRHAEIGPPTDLYQVGCLAWTLVTGSPPFGASRPAEVLALAHLELEPPALSPRFGLPPGFEVWARRLLAKSPRERFRDAAEAAHVLASLDGTRAPARSFPVGWRDRVGEGLPERLVDAGLGVWSIRSVPFVGREEARERMWMGLREVAETWRPRVVLVEGPAGAGRSRCLAWLVQRARELGVADAVLVPGTSAALGLAAALLDNPHRDHDALVGAARELGADEADAGLLASLLRPLDSGSTVAPAERVPLLARLLAVSPRPLVVALDDAHRDPEAVQLAGALSALDAPLLVLVSARPEGVAPEMTRAIHQLASGASASRLTLAPLTRSEEDELMGSALALAPGLAAEVRLRAAGNPSFAIRVVGDLAARGQLVATDAGFALVPGAKLSALAESAQAHVDHLDRVLGARAEKASVARVGLECAATLGHRVEEREWGLACEVLRVPVPRVALERMARERLVVDDDSPDGPGWRFVHAGVREALLAGAREQGRSRLLHRACAKVLSTGGNGRRGINERIGRHLHEAGDHPEALPWLLVAARRRLLRDEVREAEAVIEVAREAARLGQSRVPADRAACVEVIAAICHLRGGTPGGLRALDAALASARSGGHWQALAEGLVT
ncbi:MAG: protein kinase, partial [Deltaproteobacteria bacterium]|nr:protein kinase [Deltaproteobacteria bacterium]